MPAIEHGFTETPPLQLYLDTNILIGHLIASHDQHQRCQEFVERLIRDGTTIYLSPLSWMEYVHVVCRNDFRAALPADVRRRYRLGRWHEPRVREVYLGWVLGLLEALLADFADWVEIPLTADIRAQAVQYIREYNLHGQDAMHLAAARAAGVRDLASFDGRLRRVTGLHLWNDLVYPPPA